MLQEIQISSFTAGEFSPRMKGRTDYQRYYDSLDTCRNMVPMPQGGLTKRPGTLYVEAAHDQTATPFRVRNIPFVFSTVQPYSLEFGPGYIRPFMDDAAILGAPVVAVPYGAAEIWQVSYCQSADTLWLAHPNYPLATLTRSSHTAWSYQVFPLQDGPYSRPNTNPATTLTPSGVSGSITFTANSAAGINQDNGFLPTDVGRLLRFYSTDGAAENPVSQWVSCRITAVADILNITAAVQPASLTCAGFLAGTVAGSSFALGAFSPTLGYPITVGLWQERLALWGWRDIPNAFAASRTGAFDTFGTTEPDGTVTPRDGLFFVLEDDQVNAARWLVTAGSAQTMQLGLGSAGSENILQGATTGQPLSSTNVQAYRETQYGGATVKPLRIGKVVLFADAPARKLREWQFDWRVNGYIGPDKMQESEHMTRGPAGVPAAQWGLRWMAYQQSPHQVIWAGRNDGGLVSFTYDREQNVWAAAQHQLGGQYWGGPPIVESGCVIPSPDLSYDELWLVVLRTVAGTPRRTIEVMTRFFDALPQEAAWFVDCGLGSTLNPADIACTLAGFTALPPPDGTLAATRPPAWSGTGTLTTPAAGGAWQAGAIGWVVRINGGVLIVTGLTADPYTVAVKATRPLLGLAPGVANGADGGAVDQQPALRPLRRARPSGRRGGRDPRRRGRPGPPDRRRRRQRQPAVQGEPGHRRPALHADRDHHAVREPESGLCAKPRQSQARGSPVPAVLRDRRLRLWPAADRPLDQPERGRARALGVPAARRPARRRPALVFRDQAVERARRLRPRGAGHRDPGRAAAADPALDQRQRGGRRCPGQCPLIQPYPRFRRKPRFYGRRETVSTKTGFHRPTTSTTPGAPRSSLE